MTDGDRVCHGCHDPVGPDVDLKTVEMEYGATETLCPDCRAESWPIIVGPANEDEDDD